MPDETKTDSEVNKVAAAKAELLAANPNMPLRMLDRVAELLAQGIPLYEMYIRVARISGGQSGQVDEITPDAFDNEAVSVYGPGTYQCELRTKHKDAQGVRCRHMVKVEGQAAQPAQRAVEATGAISRNDVAAIVAESIRPMMDTMSRLMDRVLTAPAPAPAPAQALPNAMEQMQQIAGMMTMVLNLVPKPPPLAEVMATMTAAKDLARMSGFGKGGGGDAVNADNFGELLKPLMPLLTEGITAYARAKAEQSTEPRQERELPRGQASDSLRRNLDRDGRSAPTPAPAAPTQRENAVGNSVGTGGIARPGQDQSGNGNTAGSSAASITAADLSTFADLIQVSIVAGGDEMVYAAVIRDLLENTGKDVPFLLRPIGFWTDAICAGRPGLKSDRETILKTELLVRDLLEEGNELDDPEPLEPGESPEPLEVLDAKQVESPVVTSPLYQPEKPLAASSDPVAPVVVAAAASPTPAKSKKGKSNVARAE